MTAENEVDKKTNEDNVTVKKESQKKHSVTLGILAVSLLLGIIADVLLRTTFWGLNLSITVFCFVIALYILVVYKKNKPCLELLIPTLLFGILFCVRDSLFVQGLNLFVVIFCLLFLAAKATSQALQESNFGSYVVNGLRAGLILPFSPIILLFEIPWSRLSSKKSSVFVGLLRGLFFAVPILVVFGFLLSSADPVFQSIINNIFRLDFDNLFDHLFAILMFAVLFAALLRSSLLSEDWQKANVNPPAILQFGLIETILVFGSLVVLFAGFMVVQFYYLFGGLEALEKAGLTYSEYGRSGFFELVIVTVLLHLLLLIGLWLVSQNKVAGNTFKGLAFLLVVLLFGVIYSAYTRLGLYIETYGLTELRFYSMAMIFWIGVVMFYFLAKLFSEKLPKVAISYIFLGMMGVITLNIVNPDGFIARVNLERSLENDLEVNIRRENISVSSSLRSLKLDKNYLNWLSADTVPVLVNYYEAYKEKGKESVIEELLENQAKKLKKINDWRAWNLGRARAKLYLKN